MFVLRLMRMASSMWRLYRLVMVVCCCRSVAWLRFKQKDNSLFVEQTPLIRILFLVDMVGGFLSVSEKEIRNRSVDRCTCCSFSAFLPYSSNGPVPTQEHSVWITGKQRRAPSSLHGVYSPYWRRCSHASLSLHCPRSYEWNRWRIDRESSG